MSTTDNESGSDDGPADSGDSRGSTGFDDLNPIDPDLLKATIAWGNVDALIDLFAGRSEAQRTELASLLVDQRERNWPLIDEVMGDAPNRHRERNAWRTGLAALFATAELDALLRLTETEHAYEEAYSPAIESILVARKPAWLAKWIDASLEHYPCDRLIELIDRLVASGLIPVVDTSSYVSVADESADLLGDPEDSVRIAARHDAQIVAIPDAPTPLRSIQTAQNPRPLSPAASALARQLADRQALDSWHWHLASALLETRCRHDHTAAELHFDRARSLGDDHPEVLAELAFFADHVTKQKLTAERLYERALELGATVDYEIYTPELTTLLGRPHYDQSATLAKYAGFLARERDDLASAERSLEQALFVRRRLGANPAAFEPDHIAFLRQLASVASGEAPTSSLFGFDEWSGPSELTFESDV